MAVGLSIFTITPFYFSLSFWLLQNQEENRSGAVQCGTTKPKDKACNKTNSSISLFSKHAAAPLFCSLNKGLIVCPFIDVLWPVSGSPNTGPIRTREKPKPYGTSTKGGRLTLQLQIEEGIYY